MKENHVMSAIFNANLKARDIDGRELRTEDDESSDEDSSSEESSDEEEEEEEGEEAEENGMDSE